MSESSVKILLAEDEKNLAFNLVLNLEAEGYEVCLAEDGRQALAAFRKNKSFQVVVLDVMMPYIDGFEVAQAIRSMDKAIGIIMLTARAADTDRVRGFEIGVDDYLTKPFHLAELLLRIQRMVERAKLIRSSLSSDDSFKCGPFSLDCNRLVLTGPAGQCNLTSLETDVFREFFTNPGRVLSRSYLLEKVWGVSSQVETRTVDNFMVRLRRYIEKNPSKPCYLKSVRGKGYVFDGL